MRRKLPWILFGLSAVLIFLGLNWGEYGAVLEKAVSICLSCIGIG